MRLGIHFMTLEMPGVPPVMATFSNSAGERYPSAEWSLFRL